MSIAGPVFYEGDEKSPIDIITKKYDNITNFDDFPFDQVDPSALKHTSLI